MLQPKSSVSDQDITQLELKTSQQRKANFLQYLVVSLIILLSIALINQLIRQSSAWYSFVIVGLSLALNLTVFYLNRRGYTRLASHLFCHNFNLLTGSAFLLNVIVEESPIGAVLSGNIMALTILLAGMLISTRAIFGFAALNTALILTTYILFDSLTIALESGFPIIFFSYLIGVVAGF
jgi:uncharacterized protein VirK/YbjX